MDRYRFLGSLGEGGSGQVLLVEDRLRPDSRFALKRLIDVDAERVATLRREFATTAALRHPSLVEVHEFGVDADGRAYFTMEAIEGDSLVAAIRREGPDALAALAAETLRALAFLHDFGLVHRDLKPANILVRREPRRGHRVVILDFGLAVERHLEAASAAMAGTLPYLAPELIEGSPPSKRSDLYALGAVLYEAVHGRTPFALKGNDVSGFLAAVREGRRSRPAPPAGFPTGLAPWLEAMIAPRPQGRPASALDALARLNDACGASFPLETLDDRAARLGSGTPVGREAERRRLREETDPSPSPRLVWLAGDAGAGKTRLLRDLAREAVGAGRRVHVLNAATIEEADPLLTRLRGDAADSPTLVLVDEVERGDSRTATLLDRIAREPREAALHVAAAVRPGEVRDPAIKKLIADVGAVPSLARIDLAPLDDAGLEAMIERATAGRSSAKARVAWLHEASEGNPGAAEALLVEGTWERHGRVPLAEALEQSIRRRLDSLSAEARAWLEVLAVLGEDSPEALVAEISGLERVAAAAAEEVLAAGLARRSGAAVSPDSRRVGEAVRATTAPDRLRRLHVMAATHFAASERDVFGTVAWRLARLWRGAGETARAVAAALDAAQASETAKAWAEAAERYRFALASLPRRDPRRGELWTKRAEALRQAARHRESIRAFGWAARWAKDPGEKLDLLARRARGFIFAGDHEAARKNAMSVLQEAERETHEAAAAHALRVLADVHLQTFQFDKVVEFAERGLSLIRTPSELRAGLLVNLAGGLWRLGKEESGRPLAEAEAICRKGDFEYLLLIVLLSKAQQAERRGDLAHTEILLREAGELARTRKDPVWLRRIPGQLGRLYTMSGRWDLAISELRAANELATFTGDVVSATSSAGDLANSLVEVGHTAEAIAILTDQKRRLPATAPDFLRRSIDLHLALAHLAGDEAPSEDQIASLLRDTLQQEQARSQYAFAAALQAEIRRCLRWEDRKSLASLVLQAEECLASDSPAFAEAARLDLRVDIAAAQLALENLARVLELSEQTARSDSTPFAPSLYADLALYGSEALARLNREAEAAEFRDRARRLVVSASERIADPDLRRDFLDRARFKRLLGERGPRQELRRLETLYGMIRSLNSEGDPEALFNTILEMAMRAVGAERGMILLTGPTGEDFSVRLSRNLERETQSDVESFSRHIVSQASEGKSILALDAGQDERFKDFKSVSLYRIRSLMCVPLRSRGRIVGTVYLDSRRQGKPFSSDDLRFVEAFADHAALALENARRRAELEIENRRLRAAVGERASYGNIVGRSPAMQRVFDLLEKLAGSDATVLVQGESGTGKELVANAIHVHGPRKDATFLSENCAAIPESLLESALFGHVRGAFTGADRDHSGLFEQAHGGTLFLDEIGDMSPGMQARLLRVLQEGELRRVGDDHSIKVDVRVIAATNKDLHAEMQVGGFRKDLYYRLAVVPVLLPPLRERIGDVPLLATHILGKIAESKGRPALRIDAEILEALERYPWPGNVRQLENVLRRLALHAGDAPITRRVVEADAELAQMLLGKQQAFVPVMSIQKTEEEQIRRALEASGGNRDRAARLLGISRATIYRKMKEYRLR